MMSPLVAGALLPTERAGVVQVCAPSHRQARPRLGPLRGVRDTTHDTTHTPTESCFAASRFYSKFDIMIGRETREVPLDALSCNTHKHSYARLIGAVSFRNGAYLDRWGQVFFQLDRILRRLIKRSVFVCPVCLLQLFCCGNGR